MEGCFMFQWEGGLFFRWGASFLSGGGHRFWWKGFEINRKMGGVPPMPPSLWETLKTKKVINRGKRSN